MLEGQVPGRTNERWTREGEDGAIGHPQASGRAFTERANGGKETLKLKGLSFSYAESRASRFRLPGVPLQPCLCLRSPMRISSRSDPSPAPGPLFQTLCLLCGTKFS